MKGNSQFEAIDRKSPQRSTRPPPQREKRDHCDDQQRQPAVPKKVPNARVNWVSLGSSASIPS